MTPPDAARFARTSQLQKTFELVSEDLEYTPETIFGRCWVISRRNSSPVRNVAHKRILLPLALIISEGLELIVVGDSGHVCLEKYSATCLPAPALLVSDRTNHYSLAAKVPKLSNLFRLNQISNRRGNYVPGVH
jgi:hypothetical protein